MTTISFNVEHPPLVDLRGVNSITVIPFEWSGGSREFTHLAENVTYALINGVKRGNVNFIDPEILRYIPNNQFYKYVDVYLTGRIINIYYNDYNQFREERRRHEDQRQREPGRRDDRAMMLESTTRTVTVEIEYKYIRAENNKVLAYFNKIAERHRSIRNPHNNQSTRQHSRFFYTPNFNPPDSYPPDSWTNNIAASAIADFSYMMNKELDSWMTKEERTIKRSRDPDMKEAGKMIERRYFGRAYEIYSKRYEQTGDVLAGYNYAILLQFDNKYYEAMAVLEEIQAVYWASGSRVPSFITKELDMIREYIEEYELLEGYEN